MGYWIDLTRDWITSIINTATIWSYKLSRQVKWRTTLEVKNISPKLPPPPFFTSKILIWGKSQLRKWSHREKRASTNSNSKELKIKSLMYLPRRNVMRLASKWVRSSLAQGKWKTSTLILLLVIRARIISKT